MSHTLFRAKQIEGTHAIPLHVSTPDQAMSQLQMLNRMYAPSGTTFRLESMEMNWAPVEPEAVDPTVIPHTEIEDSELGIGMWGALEEDG